MVRCWSWPGTTAVLVSPAQNCTDPATGVWTPTGPLSTVCYGQTATLLPSGKVLVAGGYNGSYLSGAEVYDLASGTWAATGTMISARMHHTATLLPSGKVLVAGGEGTGYQVISSAELYDLATEKWTATGAMTAVHESHTAILLPNGKILVAGGWIASSSLSGTELYDSANGAWAASPALSTARSSHTATLLLNGNVLVAGGMNGTYPNYNDLPFVEMYDAGLAFNTSCQPQIAAFDSPVRLGNNLTLSGSLFRGVSEASGGNSQDSPTDYPVVQLHSLENGQIAFLPPAPGGAWSTNSFTSAPVSGLLPGYAMMTVFVNGIPSTSTILLLQSKFPATVTLGNLIQTYDGTSKRPTAATVPDGLTVDFTYNGSVSAPTNADNYAVVGTIDDLSYQGSTNGTLVIAKATAALSFSGSLFQMYDGTAKQVVVLTSPAGLSVSVTYDGSANAPTNAGNYLVIATITDSNHQGSLTNTLIISRNAPTGLLAIPRQNHTATLLPNGKVLVAGGYNGTYLSSAELYDPATGMWTTTGSMPTARRYHSATLMPNGKVVVVGGYNGSYLSSAELYDPATGTWTTAGSMPTARGYHTATLMPNGKVMVVGGYNGGYLSSSVLYDPATETWSTANAMTSARQNHTATLLPNGKLLVSGGQGSSSTTNSAETVRSRHRDVDNNWLDAHRTQIPHSNLDAQREGHGRWRLQRCLSFQLGPLRSLHRNVGNNQRDDQRTPESHGDPAAERETAGLWGPRQRGHYQHSGAVRSRHGEVDGDLRAGQRTPSSYGDVAAEWEGADRGRCWQQRLSGQRRAVRSDQRDVDGDWLTEQRKRRTHGDLVAQREGARRDGRVFRCGAIRPGRRELDGGRLHALPSL